MSKFKAYNSDQLRSAWPHIKLAIDKYSDDKGFEVVVRRPNKTRDQEEKYHAMINDIANHRVIDYCGYQVDFKDYGYDPASVAKVMLLCWFEDDLKAQGKSLKKPSGWIIAPKVQMPVMVRARSSEFTLQEGSDFIEFLYSIGSVNRVVWSDPETKAYEEMQKQGSTQAQ